MSHCLCIKFACGHAACTKNIQITLDNHTCGLDLKKHVIEVTGRPDSPDIYKLVLAGKEVPDEAILSSLKIRDGSTVFMVSMPFMRKLYS